jgi:hypothetical protein
MEHQSSNKNKSINGRAFENEFTSLTGIKKTLKKDKPRFINSHGLSQVVDFDYITTIEGNTFCIDVTTTFRSDRLKQKSYNALMMKQHTNMNCKFYMVVKSLTEKGKTKKPILIEGIDNVLEIGEFMKLLNP